MLTMRTKRGRDRELAAAKALEENDEKARAREEARMEKEEERKEGERERDIARAEREQISSEQKEIIEALKTLTMAKQASETMEKALQQNADFLKNSIEQAEH
ncbi:hypothetical protein ONZ45_g10969 [Pleurotus djamor]|nr:hypothetical protein ONZ45_g10969 [Pleurotus djamor]